jgi:hypothetical protein
MKEIVSQEKEVTKHAKIIETKGDIILALGIRIYQK